ncbi:MAG TPA: hypothetical protein VHX43_08015 [Xanthobacteraceae bacterium]|jgi:hypothetical protein|nr:hypothetical protein [Xanthobacteraceae bacterium]
MRTLEALRHRIEPLPPYASLLLIGVPLAVVEPLKLAIVLLAGDGHWLTGIFAMIGAYAVSLFITHWLFGVVKPKLLKLSWFATLWNWYCATRDKVWDGARGRSVRRAK